jgi:hypothetical protein
MKPKLPLVLALAFAAGVARADYNGDFSSAAVTGDFRFALIGTFGAITGIHNAFYWTNNALRLEGRYVQQASEYLKVTGSGSATDGRYSNDVSASFTFTYSTNSSSTNTYVGFGLDTFTNAGVNTYPTYRFVIQTNTLLLQKQAGYSTATNYATASVPLLGSTNVYKVTFSAFNLGTNAFGKIVDLSASLYANGSLVAALSYTDTPTSAALGNLGTSLSGGYIGIAAGAGPQSTGVFYGINLTGLAVAIPEPTALLLLAGGLAGLATARRLRR